MIRRIARPLLAATFVASGIDAVQHPAGRASLASGLLEKVGPALGLPDDTELLVRANGAVMLGGGLLLATGRAPRLGAAALAASLVPTTLAGHRFWEQPDPIAKGRERQQFLKNAGLLGGLLLAVVDTEGRPGLAWRARSARRAAAKKLESAQESLG